MSSSGIEKSDIEKWGYMWFSSGPCPENDIHECHEKQA